MPDSAGTIEEIHNSLKASLGGGRSTLDEDVVAASKRILLHDIEFRASSVPYSMQQDDLRAKYNPLNPSKMQGKGWTPGSVQHQGGANGSQSEKNGEHLPSPRVILYPEEKIKMDWSHMSRIGAGLFNLGNTCFFNSTLQCLTYTAPLVNYCFTADHKEKCRKKDFCMMCEIQKHIKLSLNSGGRPIKPHSILQKLRCIAKHMKWGRQEDAHEFLRFVVDHLQQSCLNGESHKLDRFSKETTVINQIFGGYLRSQVTCLKCQGKSNTFDPFMDLSLDIKGVSSVEDALNKYVKPETLDFDNAYMCPRCKTKVRAQKRFSIQKAPNILTLQLNRFDFNRHLAGKMTKFIRYPEKINLRNYMSQRQGEPALYHLYGVIVHSGYSSDHGHYYSYVKSATKTWFCMNDASVHAVNPNTVFNADAYVLFYARINKIISSNITPSSPHSVQIKSPSTSMKGPHPSSGFLNHVKHDRSPLVNGVHAYPSSELGTPIKRGSDVPHSPSPKIVPHATSASTLPGAHSKISFPILTAQQRKQHQLDGKRIVLQIKDGNSKTMEKSPDGKSKLVNGERNGLAGLVPYRDEDSDSEQENHSEVSYRLKGPGLQHGAGDKSHLPGPTANNKILHLPSEGRGDADSSRPSVKAHHTPVHNGPLPASQKKHKPPSIPSSVWSGEKTDAKTSGIKHQTVKNGLESHHPLAKSLFPPPASAEQNAPPPPSSPLSHCTKRKEVESQQVTPRTQSAPSSQDRTPVDLGDRLPLLSPTSSSENGAKKAKKHKKKHKKKLRESQSSQQEDSSSRSDSSSHKKKKHKKKVEHKHRHIESLDSDDDTSTRQHKKKVEYKHRHTESLDSDDDTSTRQHKKKVEYKHRRTESLDSDDDTNTGHKGRKEESDSSTGSDYHHRHKRKRGHTEEETEYVWVEKKVEHVPSKVKVKHTNKVSEHRWNSHSKDDVAPRRHEEKKKSLFTWDGLRTSKVTDYLGSSHHGLASVKSWDGGQNHVSETHKGNHKRHWADDYNETIDSGKTKKVKKHKADTGYTDNNPFQNHYTYSKNSDKKSWWREDHNYPQQAPLKKKTYPAQPWLNSDFDPRQYKISPH